MHTASAALQNLLKQSHTVSATARVIAEWNHNRYKTISYLDNWGYPEAQYGFDIDMFKISSIAEPVRPVAGQVYAMTGESQTFVNDFDNPPSVKYMTVDPDNNYKYWISPTKSNFSGAIANVNPAIVYSSSVQANKVYICIENSWAAPNGYAVQVTTDGTNWTTIATNPAIGAGGVVELYLQSNGTWSTTVARNNPTLLAGVRLAVTNMNRTGARFSLIEMGLRLERDLSDRLIEYSVDNELDGSDLVSPFGNISSNTASVTLDNLDAAFNNENTSSIYYKIVDSNVKVTCDLLYNASAYGGSTAEAVRQFTMYTDVWNPGEDVATVSLRDASSILQELNPPALLLQDVTIGEAIWRILDSVGFSSYAYIKSASQGTTVIPFYWTDEEQTVWDTIQEICRTTQSAAYFDEYGVFRILTREAAFDFNKAETWTLDGDVNGSKLPDIVDLNVDGQYEANKVTITYKPTGLAVDDLGRPLSEVVWQPEGNVVLRSGDLSQDMDSTQKYFYIAREEAETWPYDGFVNIRGELIKYEGKEYRYVQANGAWANTILKTADEKRRIDNEFSNADKYFRNYFTGRFEVLERGYDVTYARDHKADITGWYRSGAYYGGDGGAQSFWTGGITHLKAQSTLRLSTPSTNVGEWYTVRRGNQHTKGTPKYYGTRMKFPTNPRGRDQAGGLFFYSNSGGSDMYTVDIVSTAEVNEGTRRDFQNEVRIIKRYGGVITRLAGTGAEIVIPQNEWFDVDVNITGNTIQVMINGVVAVTASDNSGGITPTNFFGMYVRGHTVADFEYYYTATNGLISEHTDNDNSSFLDVVRGGYFSARDMRQTVYNSAVGAERRGAKSFDEKAKYAENFFDEFGVTVHEVRPYDIEFEKGPVLYSSLFMTNTAQSVVDEYIGGPFGAKFVVANAARRNVVVNGEDTLTLGSDNSIEHKMVVTGRTVQQKEEEDYVVKNDAAIRARGEVPLDINSDWIQTESAAKALGDWIIAHWSEPCDEVEVNVFGNALFQIGDKVSVNYAPRSMVASTHKYFVTKVSHQFDGGLETSLTLRRARI